MRTRISVLLFALAFVLGGCAMTKDYVRIGYVPQGSPPRIAGAENIKLRVDVQDYRSIKDRVSAKKNGFGAETAPIIAENRISDLFAGAISTELTHRGFQIGDGGLVVTAEINRFYNDFKAGMMSGNAVAEAAMNVTVRSKDGRTLFSRGFSAEGSHSGFSTLDGPNAKIALDSCLANIVSRLFSDTEFNAALTGGSALAQLPGQAPARAIASDIDDVPAPAVKPRPKAHAVVIGVEQYREKLPAADFAAADARLVSLYLIKLMGYPEENVATLLDGRANRSDFEKYIERWLANRVGPGDDVFVYYSGHGAPNPVSGDAYLLPYDGDPAYLAETAYPLARLYGQIARLPTKNVTIVIDSCFSGAGGRSVIEKGARPLVMASPAAIPTGLTVLTASSGAQISHSYNENGHGLFTYFLLKGLKEQAGGPIDFRKAFDYAAPQVSRLARRQYNRDQTPLWSGATR
jgi:uncharacterized lipoprotein YajG